MLNLSLAFMALTFVIFAAYGGFAAAVRRDESKTLSRVEKFDSSVSHVSSEKGGRLEGSGMA